jgi:hypothetical protein
VKIRTGFVSNSSSSSFIIINTTTKDLNIIDFAKETDYLVERFNEEYDCTNSVGDFLKDASNDDRILHPGDNKIEFGDEDGTMHGTIYDYMLRRGGKTKQFKWKFHEALR